MYNIYGFKSNIKVVLFFLLVTTLCTSAYSFSQQINKEKVVQPLPKYMKYHKDKACTVTFKRTLHKGKLVTIKSMTHERPNVMVLYHTNLGTYHAEVFNDDIECI